jgi:hypothetical protein
MRLAQDENSAVSKVAQLQRGSYDPSHRLVVVLLTSATRYAELEAERAGLTSLRSEVTKMEADTRSMPVEVDAARAAEAAGRAQLVQQQAGA